MPRMISWSDRSYFSIQRDEHVSRVSGWDDNHQEYWLEVLPGKGYASRREEALLAIQGAIEAGELPGEVQLPKE